MGDRKRGRYLYHAKDVLQGDYVCNSTDNKCTSFKCEHWRSRWVENDSGRKKVEYGFCALDHLRSVGVDNEQ
jgi:hypothetical protein